MNIKYIKQSSLTAECWSVQMFGTSKCKECEFHNTKQCGGKNIIKTGKNSIGRSVTSDGVVE